MSLRILDDEIKIYKGALTSAEVFNDYTAIDTFGARLLNYWPMNNLSDIVGGKDLFEGVNYLFTNDRFNNANSSIHFNNGFLKVPTGCYFSGDFSVVAWVKLNSNNPYQRLFDFANGPDMDNVVLDFTSNREMIAFIAGSNAVIAYNYFLELGAWYHLGFVIQGTTGYFYVNTTEIKRSSFSAAPNVTRTKNFIGRSNYEDTDANATYDDIKIYEGVLTQTEIHNEFLGCSNIKRGKTNLLLTVKQV